MWGGGFFFLGNFLDRPELGDLEGFLGIDW